MADIDISNELAELAAEEGERQYKKFTKDRVEPYYKKFITLRSEIQGAYQRQATTIQQRYAVGRLAKKAIDEGINSYPSGKGGADILPKDELETLMKQYEERNAQLVAVRQALYDFGENKKKVKKLSLQAMTLVMMLKQDITESKEEQFAFIYKGEGGAAYNINVPMHTILLNEAYLDDIDLEYNAIDRWNGGEDQKLSFKLSIIEQIKKTQGIDGQKMSDFMESYDSLKGKTYTTKENFYPLSKNFYKAWEQAKKAYAKNPAASYVIRWDERYLVIERQIVYQTGFIAQGLFSKLVLNDSRDIEELAKPDNNPWYGMADAYNENSQLSYSVKSFLEGDPSLISLNSLYQVTENIIDKMHLFLKSHIEFSDMKEYLKNQVFQGAKVVSDAFNNDVDKIVKRITR